jgi:hypothetical protein
MKFVLWALAILVLISSSAFAQISYVGQCTGTTSCTSPTHQTNDLFLIGVGRDGSTTAPTIPGGWTAIGSAQTINGTSTADSYFRTFCKIAASSGETVTGFTSASNVTVVVYRGTKQASDCSTVVGTPVTNTTAINTTTTTVTYGTVTNGDSRGWDVGFAYAPAATAGLGTAPTGMTNRATSGSTKLSAHDTNAAVASFTTQNVTVTTAGRVMTLVMEIEAPQQATLTPAPSMAVTALADLGAQFDINAAAMVAGATAAATVSTFTCSGVCGVVNTNFTPSLSATADATAGMATSNGASAAATVAANAQNAIAQNIAPAVTASLTSVNGVAQSTPVAVTAGATVSNFTKAANFSLSPTMAATVLANLGAQFDINASAMASTTSVSVTPTFRQGNLRPTLAVTADGQVTDFSCVGACGGTIDFQLFPDIAVTADATADFDSDGGINGENVNYVANAKLGSAFSIPLSLSAAASVTDFTQTVFSLNFSFNPLADLTSTNIPLITTGESGTADAATDLTAELVFGRNFAADISSTADATSRLGTSTTIDQVVGVDVLAAFTFGSTGAFSFPISADIGADATVQQDSGNTTAAGASADMTPTMSAGVGAVLAASADMSCSFSVTRAHRRRVIVM